MAESLVCSGPLVSTSAPSYVALRQESYLPSTLHPLNICLNLWPDCQRQLLRFPESFSYNRVLIPLFCRFNVSFHEGTFKSGIVCIRTAYDGSDLGKPSSLWGCSIISFGTNGFVLTAWKWIMCVQITGKRYKSILSMKTWEITCTWHENWLKIIICHDLHCSLWSVDVRMNKFH